MNQRTEFVLSALKTDNFRALCQEYGISAKTGYKWKERFLAEGADVLEALGSHPMDCLLLDLHMEGVSGFEVLEAFLARQIHVPVIVITAHDEPGTAEQVRGLGAVAYLKKPVDRDALFAAISAALAHHRPTVTGNPS